MTIESCIDCGRSYGVQICSRCYKKRLKKRGENERKVIKLLPYEQAQIIVQELGIKNSAEYYEYYRSGKFPEGMPSNPARTYSTPDSTKKVSRLDTPVRQ